MKIAKGNTKNLPLEELIKRLSTAKFSGRLILNEGEHFCILEFFNGNIIGAFGWKLEGDNAILHLLLECKDFDFSLPSEIDLDSADIFNNLPRGTQHILDLISRFKSELGVFAGSINKKIVMNDELNSEVDVSSEEMKEIIKFVTPMPVGLLADKDLEQNLFRIGKFLSKKLLVIKD